MAKATTPARGFTARHQLYRLYGANGDLLYIGRTNSVGTRFDGHAKKQPWWHEVVDCRVEFLPDYDALIEAERIAIEQERPRYNIQHNENWPWLEISQRVTGAACFLHRDCDEPGDGVEGRGPCRKCFRKAAWLLSYSDAQGQTRDEGVMEAQRVSHDWDPKARQLSKVRVGEEDFARIALDLGWHPCLILERILANRERRKSAA